MAGSKTEWTNNEASRSKLALSQLGYLEDRFVGHFCSTPLKRTPEINRGFYFRVCAVTHCVRSFCLREGATDGAQIVNIGAGFDTLFWRLKDDPQIKLARYVDVDSNEVIAHKIKVIKQNESLLSACGVMQQSIQPSSLHSTQYHAIAQDATRGMQLSDRLIRQCQIDPNQPVLFIFECVLLYWSQEACTNLFEALNRRFAKCNFVVFDLVNTDDKFSNQMQQTLSEQDTPLLGASSVRTLQDWDDRFLKSGCKYVQSWLMTEVHDNLIDPQERRRIECIEFLDETELLTQLFQHYCLVLASSHVPVCW